MPPRVEGVVQNLSAFLSFYTRSKIILPTRSS